MKNLKNVPEWNLSDFYSSPKDKKISLEIKNIEKASEKFSKDFSKQLQQKQKSKKDLLVLICNTEEKMFSLSPEHMSILNHEHDLHDLLPCATNHLNYALGVESSNICSSRLCTICIWTRAHYCWYCKIYW